ncbi:MAG: sugar phosphate isomerase/epimerase [Clostridia bacterium]|nr:sugar phosphate isomerase/epimerase [Clostridia bacterium]
MKLSATTYELRKVFGEEKGLAMMKEAGFDGVDYTFCEKEDWLKGDYIAKAHQSKALLDKYGLKCLQAHAPFDWTIEKEEEFFPYIIRAIEYAGILESPYIVVHSPLVFWENFTVDDAYLEMSRKYYKSLEPHARKAGIKIAVETLIHWDYKSRTTAGVLSDPQMMKDFIKSLDSDVFVVCADLGHLALAHVEPQDFIRQMDNKLLQTLHVQDVDYICDLHTLPGQGNLNWNEICNALREIDYQGAFNYEAGRFWNGFDEDLKQDALNLAVKVGRKLIDKIESSK